MTEGFSVVESSPAAQSAGLDFAHLALALSSAHAVRLETRTETVRTGGMETGEPISIYFDGGRLLLFGGRQTEEFEALVRRLAAHLRSVELDADRVKALTIAERANDIARSAARRFETLFEGLPIACYACDTEGRLMEWNRAAEETWPEIASAWGDEAAVIVHPDDPAVERAAFERALAGEPVRGEERATHVDGEERWHLVHAFPLRDAEGTGIGAIVARLDVTGRREAQRELADGESRLRTVLETLDEGLIVVDEAGRVVLRNESAERILRLNTGPMELTSAYPHGTVMDAEGVSLSAEERPIIQALRKGKSARDVRLGLLPPGATQLLWVDVNAEPLRRAETGDTIGAVATFRQIPV